MKRLYIVFLVLVCFILPVMAQQRGGDLEVVDARQAVSPQGKQWAVFIAIDEYKEWGALKYPVKDAQDIKNILLDNYYIDKSCIMELYNNKATVSAIRLLFAELSNKVELNDSVFVFHAGHGVKEEKTKTSALVAYDGVRDYNNQTGWLPHVQIRSMLDALRARHVFLISDSCYSGDLVFTTRGNPETIENIPAAYLNKSRQVMSSGASEEVDDVSEFASRLKDTLERTEAPYITPDFLFYQIKFVPTMRKLTTEPNLGPIPESGHIVGGSFLFFRKNPKPGITLQTYQSAETSPAPVTRPAVGTTPAPPVIDAKPGEKEYFLGSWITTVEYNGSYDTYEINFSANNSCMVKVSNDKAQQETKGNWSWNGKNFRLEAVFRSPTITYLPKIEWLFPVNFDDGNNAFRILGRAATNGPQVRITFWRDN
jgi:hypothetical protein